MKYSTAAATRPAVLSQSRISHTPFRTVQATQSPADILHTNNRERGNSLNPSLSSIPAGRFRADKPTPAKAGAEITARIGQFKLLNVSI
jgi:hypothetical protein